MSMMPGVTHLPDASITSKSSVTGRSLPMAAIFLSLIKRSVFSNSFPSPSYIFAFLINIFCEGSGV